jgi:hypothetical protein
MAPRRAVRDERGRWDAWWLFFAALVAYTLTCPGATAYDQYALFANAMLDGSLSLPKRPPHLEMAEYQGRAFFTNPPTPALLLVPVIFIAEREPFRTWLVEWNGGWNLPFGWFQTGLSLLLGASSVGIARLALGKVVSRTAANWGAILFGFGSIYWYHSTIGSVWYLAQAVHGTAMWLLCNEWLGKKRPMLMGLWIAAAFWCRMETLVAAPFILVTTTDRWLHPMADERIPRLRWRWVLRLAFPVLSVIVLNWLYNYVRYGTIENWGYRMLIEKPEVAPMFPHGLFSYKYAPAHVQVLFNSWPIFQPTFPWVLPKVSGTAIWMTTPAFVYALRAPWDRLTLACWVGILLFLVILVHHCGTGMTQFGYRFALDFYPLLTILTMRAMDRPIRWWHVALIVLSVAINAWGVYVLNILSIQRLF